MCFFVFAHCCLLYRPSFWSVVVLISLTEDFPFLSKSGNHQYFMYYCLSDMKGVPLTTS